MQDLRPLFERRLIVVSGKGGTGKTTVAAALALEASRRGMRVGVIETGRHFQLGAVLGQPGPDPGYGGVELGDGLWAMRMEPYAALAEYLRLQLRIPGLVTRLLDQPAFHALLDAAPGWRELITLGKVWHLEQARDAKGNPVWDLLIVDAPATGHGLTFLDVPSVVVSAVRAGPLHRHVVEVEAMVRDPERTVLLPVTLPEELPVRETIELVTRAKDEIGIDVDRLVVNASLLGEELDDDPELASRIEALAHTSDLPTEAIAHAVRQLGERTGLHREAERELTKALALPTVRLPALVEDATGPTALGRLAEPLERPRTDR